jgi:hypothetical protein
MLQNSKKRSVGLARCTARRIGGASVKLVLIRLRLDRIETTESGHEV